MTLRILRSLAIAAFAIALAGCSQTVSNDAPLTQRQRDSLISKSALPGAAVVGRALSETDHAARQAANIDSMTSALPR